MHNVLKIIKPSRLEERKIKAITKKIINKIRIPGTKVILGGSGAKGTWLKGTYDIDIYVKFDLKKYKDKDISGMLKKELKKNFSKLITLKGSRDYFQIKEMGFTSEIIPILDIKNVKDALNITDVSPFHAEWVKKYKLQDEIRLAKAFCRAQDCYGAESYIRGFSGYALEVLTIYYKSFNNLIKNVAKWKRKEFIDPARHGVKLNKAKTASPLILIDPVQADRNVTAALSFEKYKKFISAAKEYLKSPSEKFFIKEEFSVKKLKLKYKDQNLIVLKVIPLKGKEDVIGAKIMKVYEYIRYKLKKEDFKIIGSYWYWNRYACLWFAVDKKPLSKFKIHYGPKLLQDYHVNKFKEKNKGCEIFIENNRIAAKKPREFSEPLKFLKFLIKNDRYIKEKVKAVSLNL